MKLILCLFIICTFSFSKIITVTPCDCFEELEQDIVELVNGKMPSDEFKIELKKIVKEKCPDKIKKRIFIDKSADIKDCIENLESEIIKIVANSKQDNQEISVDIVIGNINKNFEECKYKANCIEEK